MNPTGSGPMDHPGTEPLDLSKVVRKLVRHQADVGGPLSPEEAEFLIEHVFLDVIYHRYWDWQNHPENCLDSSEIGGTRTHWLNDEEAMTAVGMLWERFSVRGPKNRKTKWETALESVEETPGEDPNTALKKYLYVAASNESQAEFRTYDPGKELRKLIREVLGSKEFQRVSGDGACPSDGEVFPVNVGLNWVEIIREIGKREPLGRGRNARDSVLVGQDQQGVHELLPEPRQLSELFKEVCKAKRIALTEDQAFVLARGVFSQADSDSLPPPGDDRDKPVGSIFKHSVPKVADAVVAEIEREDGCKIDAPAGAAGDDGERLGGLFTKFFLWQGSPLKLGHRHGNVHLYTARVYAQWKGLDEKRVSERRKLLEGLMRSVRDSSGLVWAQFGPVLGELQRRFKDHRPEFVQDDPFI
jgi:hypothetical protein